MKSCVCKYCNRDCKNPGGLITHEPYCKHNPNRIKRNISQNSYFPKGYVPWNKGLVGDPRCKCSEETKKHLSLVHKCVVLTPEKENERRKKISKTAKEIGMGGYRLGSGRGKKGWYKNIFCDSSWELAFVIYCLEHNYIISRCNEKRTYIFNNQQKLYYPDFVVNGKIYEIKGYKTIQWEAKLLYNKDIICLYKDDMKVYLDYVINKYGKDYIKLYDK